MANLQAVSVGLYYPTQLRVVAGISHYLKLPQPAKGQSVRLLDPCCGKGSAALFLTRLLAQQTGNYVISPPAYLADLTDLAEAENESATPPVRRSSRLELYGIEVEETRAQLAAPQFTHLLNTDSATARIQESGFDLIWHNPPYDSAKSDDEEAEGRLEYAFLRRATRYLKPEGVLVHLIPQRRLEKAAEHLAHFYRDIHIFRFPYPEYHYFRQIILLAVRRKSYTADHLTAQRLKELARISAAALPPLACPTAPELETLLAATNLPLTEEDQKELEILRGAAQLEAPQSAPDFSLSVPTGRESKRLLFRSGGYEPTAALTEAKQQGVWQNRVLIEEVAGVQTQRQVRPLLPMREGQLALLTAAGLLDNTVLEDGTGKRALVRGSLHKEWVLKEIKEDENGRELSRTLREVLKLKLYLRDLTTGQKREIGAEEMGEFLGEYGENLRQRMLELYPPLYLPGKRGQGALLEGLEAGLSRLKRKPLKAQRFAIVAASLALLTGRCATLSAEQGSGKSFMGAAAAWLSGSRRVLVICPPHLVEKWGREVSSTVPGARAEIVRNVTELREAVARIQRHEALHRQPETNLLPRRNQQSSVSPQLVPPYFLIISREAMKLSHQWEAAVVFRAYRDDEGKLSYVPHCPSCGAAVLEKGVPVPLSKLRSKKYTCRGTVKSWRWNEEKQRHLPDLRSCGERLWQAVANPVGETPFRLRDDATSPTKPSLQLPLAQTQPQAQTQFQTQAQPQLQAQITERIAVSPPQSQSQSQINKRTEHVRTAQSLRLQLSVPPKPTLPAGKGPRRLSLSRYIARNLPGFFDLLIGDEVQEYKANGSAQGISLGRLSEVCGKTLVMTGTFAGGYASNLYWLLMRFSRLIRQEYGFSSAEEWRFIDHFGVIEKTIFGGGDSAEVSLEDGAMSDRRGYAKVQLTEKPGLSPAVLTLMMGHTVFLQLADVATDLPPYQEHVITIPPEGETGAADSQLEKYRYLEDKLRKALQEALQEGSSRLLGVMINTLLWWVDQPFKPEVALDPRYKERLPKEEVGKLTPASPCLAELPPGAVIAALPAGDAQKLYPKELELQKLYQREKSAKRKLLVFVSNTQGRDIMPRVEAVLKQVGARVALLRSDSVEASKREHWIGERLKEGYDVLIAQPVSVQTGLDLLAYPTIAFYQMHPSTFVVRQASRRSWRIGQTQPVHVYYFAYAGTAQEGLLHLMAKKVQASRMLEGNLDGDGLVGLADEGEGGSLVMALARQIAGQPGVPTETAVSLEEMLSRLHAADLESARFLLDEEASEAEVEAAIHQVYATLTETEAAPIQTQSLETARPVPEMTAGKRRPTLEELRQQLLEARQAKLAARKKNGSGQKAEGSHRQLTLLDWSKGGSATPGAGISNDKRGEDEQGSQLTMF